MLLLLEKTIFKELLTSGEYAEKVVPYFKERYFQSAELATLYRLYEAFFQKFHSLPSIAVLRIGIDATATLSETEAKAAQVALDEIAAEAELDDAQRTWLIEESEEYCQERAMYCALQDAIKVMDDPKATRHVIPDLMKEALAVSFDTKLGHDFIEDADARYAFYHKQEARLPFDLGVFNTITKGGVPKKTLNVVMAGTNVGKSLFLVHLAAAYLRMSKNVLYITLEMAEERIAERVDANLMNLPIDDVNDLPEVDYVRKMQHIKQLTTGKLIIKEYPTGAAHVGHFRTLIQELRLKQNFRPDAIMVDYITICAAARIKATSNVNSFERYKAVAEELRGLAVENDVPVWSAAQFNRDGFASSDPSLDQVGESWAIPQTADFMFALITTEELEKLGQMAVSVMKNRYAKKRQFQHELIGVDTDRMKLYDLTPAQMAASVNVPPSSVNTPTPGNASYQTFGKRKRRPLQALRKDKDTHID